MLPNSWTTGAKLVIFNEITKFYRPKDASFFRRREVFWRFFVIFCENILEIHKQCLYLQSQSERDIIHTCGCGEMVDTLL